MRGDQPRRAARRRRASRPFSGSSSSHSGAPDGHDPRQRRALAPGPSTAAAPARAASARGRARPSPPSRSRPPQKRQRAPERQLAVERECIVGQRTRARARPCRGSAAAGRRQGGSGSTCRCRWARRRAAPRPAPSARSSPSNSSRPPRTQRHALERAAARSRDLLLERVHVVVAEAEMMADLVDQDVRDEMLERSRRPPIRRGSGGGTGGCGRAGCPMARRFARSAERLRRCRSGRTGRSIPIACERRVVGEFLDQQHDVAEAAPRTARASASSARARDRLDLVGRRRAGPKRRMRIARIGAASAARQACPLGRARRALMGAPSRRMRSGGRVVEGARLESEYTAKPYRGFESLPLRHPINSPKVNAKASAPRVEKLDRERAVADRALLAD